MIMYTSYHPQVEADPSLISSEPINAPEIFAAVHDPKAGAVVLFSGEVRNHSHGKQVSYLEYEAYEPMAKRIIMEILEDAKKKWEIHKLICIHRVGKVAVGESAILVITCSSHRDNAYEANRYIVDRMKHEAPIWKKEFFEDGTCEWGHNCSCFNHK
jgi:molybdopterin synthase catalytic subunit